MFRMLTICKTICVIVMLVFSSGLPTGSTQFVIGKHDNVESMMNLIVTGLPNNLPMLPKLF